MLPTSQVELQIRQKFLSPWNSFQEKRIVDEISCVRFWHFADPPETLASIPYERILRHPPTNLKSRVRDDGPLGLAEGKRKREREREWRRNEGWSEKWRGQRACKLKRGGNETTKKDAEKGARGKGEEKSSLFRRFNRFRSERLFSGLWNETNNGPDGNHEPSLMASRVYASTCTCTYTG